MEGRFSLHSLPTVGASSLIKKVPLSEGEAIELEVHNLQFLNFISSLLPYFISSSLFHFSDFVIMCLVLGYCWNREVSKSC